MLYIVGKVFENWIQMTRQEYCTAWPEVEIQDGGLQTRTVTWTHISQLVGTIETKFRKLYQCFWEHLSNETIGNVVRLNRKWEVQDGGLQNWINLYLGLWTWKKQNSNGYNYVFGVWQHGETSGKAIRCGYVVNKRLRPKSGSKNDIT